MVSLIEEQQKANISWEFLAVKNELCDSYSFKVATRFKKAIQVTRNK
jgi:hypothetical protein